MIVEKDSTLALWAWILLLAILLVLSIILSISMGQVKIPLSQMLDIIRQEGHSLFKEIIVNLRLPRALAGALCGFGLSICGLSMQAVVRNPLADPYLMGISSGAGLGAAASILWLGSAGPSLPIMAFLGALIAGAMVFALGSRSRAPVYRLILAGLAMNVLCSSLTGLLVFFNVNPQRLQNLSFWLMGSLAPATWTNLIWPCIITVLGSFFFWFQGRNLNLISLDDDESRSLGASPQKLRLIYLIIISLITSSLTAFFGIIGFVGLIVPHIMRFFVGSDHLRLAPLTALCGGIFMVLVDTLARSAADSEIPLGVITGVIGAPFFFWLLLRPTKRG
ncbi:MAG: iron ABC transporter permease [Deltaproteobacteria bacterium]|jgi:iron complex transport system permease protein|nr:iron ABC transporter permease [Deltaproteobacteria bacterium]